jgi:tetratricopeptide (TPR) repeat protein
MGLFSFLSGKTPEEIEVVGDGYYKIEEFGAAKIEYEKALQKAEKKFPEKTNLIQKLSGKIAQTKEALAQAHLRNAETLILSKTHEEAEGLLQLVLELTGNQAMKEKAMTHLKAIQKDRNMHVAQVHDAGETILKHFDQREDEKSLDDYFAILCSSLPEETQDEYYGYGQSFKSGYVALNIGDFEAAAAQLDAALSEHPHPQSQIPVELATALVHLHQFDKAADILVQYIRQNQDSLRGYQVLCEVYWDKGNFDHAINLLNSCPDALKSTFPVQMLLGETYYQSGRYGEAVQVFEAAIAEFNFNEMIARSLAKSYEAIGDIQKAKDLYGKIMVGCQSCGSRIDPFVKARYAELCFHSGDMSDRLLETYFSLIQEDSDNKYQYYQRIQKIYKDMGNEDQARRYRAMAESVAP